MGSPSAAERTEVGPELSFPDQLGAVVGPKTATGDDSYVLCEINASSPFALPPHAMNAVAQAAIRRIQERALHSRLSGAPHFAQETSGWARRLANARMTRALPAAQELRSTCCSVAIPSGGGQPVGVALGRSFSVAAVHPGENFLD